MAKSFPSKSAPSHQSTPKPGSHLVPLPVQDPSAGQDALDLSVPRDHLVPFVAPNSDPAQRSVDSGFSLNLSRIGESTDPGCSGIAAEEDVSWDPHQGKIEEIDKMFLEPVEGSPPEDWPLLHEVGRVFQEINEEYSSFEQLINQPGLMDGDVEGDSD